MAKTRTRSRNDTTKSITYPPPTKASGDGASANRAVDLDAANWRVFLGQYLLLVAGQARRFNGRPIRSEADCRAVYRWLEEGVSPTLWCADRVLTKFGLHIDLYFGWCAIEGKSAWRLGKPPAWHEEEIDAEALRDWRDPEEVRESTARVAA